MVATTDAGLHLVECYYDRAPRASATAEEVGPFTLFLRSDPRGWPFYARPRSGPPGEVTAADVRLVRQRQRDLVVPEPLEWVDELVPCLARAARQAGRVVHEHPLMVLTRHVPAPRVPDVEMRLLTADDGTLGAVQAAVGAGFEESDEAGSGDDADVRDRVAHGTSP